MPELEHIFIWGLFGFCASLALDLQRRIRSKPDTDYDEDKLRAAPPPFRPIPRTSPDLGVRITPQGLWQRSRDFWQNGPRQARGRRATRPIPPDGVKPCRSGGSLTPAPP